MTSPCLYLIGSLRNERIPVLANKLREENPHMEVFDDWYSAGPSADDYWKEHQLSKGLVYRDALRGHAARNVFSFDKKHLDRSTHAILVLPAGKSGHMEIMYAAYGVGARAAILLDSSDVRWDVMYQFIGTVLEKDEDITEWLNSKEPNMTKKNQGQISSRRKRSSVLPKSLALVPKNTRPIIGEAALNTADLLGPLCGTY